MIISIINNNIYTQDMQGMSKRGREIIDGDRILLTKYSKG